MANILIKGNKERSEDILSLLEMLGGKNSCKLIETHDCFYYYTISDNSIVLNTPDAVDARSSVKMTLEEFEKKYPYKIGDKVTISYEGLPYTATIDSMRWSDKNECVLYQVGMVDNVRVEHILPVENKSIPPYMDYDIKDNPMEDKGTLVEIDLTRELKKADEIEVILGDYEFVLKDGKTYFVKKKPQYPKTFYECCNIVGAQWCGELNFGPHDGETQNDYNLKLVDILEPYRRLLIYRDAYWKIAGVQMGLGKAWEPSDTKDKYIIRRAGDEILKGYKICCVLEFPTAEMRDAFYENFKELVEQCKELL